MISVKIKRIFPEISNKMNTELEFYSLLFYFKNTTFIVDMSFISWTFVRIRCKMTVEKRKRKAERKTNERKIEFKFYRFLTIITETQQNFPFVLHSHIDNLNKTNTKKSDWPEEVIGLYFIMWLNTRLTQVDWIQNWMPINLCMWFYSIDEIHSNHFCILIIPLYQ